MSSPYSGRHINTQLHDWYWQSILQKQAYSVIVTELFRHPFTFDKESKKWDIDLFLKRITWELCIYGYLTYNSYEKTGLPDIISGRYVAIKRKHKKYRPYVHSIHKHIDIKTKDLQYLGPQWKVIILTPPVFNAQGDYKHPTSCSFNAYEPDKYVNTLLQNSATRDGVNSGPAVYTKISKDLAVAPGISKPWFQTNHTNMAPGISSRVDVDTLVQQRAETMGKLDELSDKMRAQITAKHQTQDPFSAKAKLEASPIMSHKEHIVSDGRDCIELRHLQGPDQFLPFMKTKTAQVMFAWNVPPQVLGENINSERLASSNRLSEMAIDLFRNSIQLLKEAISQVLDEKFEFKNCLDTHTLNDVIGILKPSVAITMMSCTHNVPENYFDINAVKEFQLYKRTEGHGPDTSSEGSDQKKRVKSSTTDSKKVSKSVKKAKTK